MALLFGIVLDGVVTLLLGIVIFMEGSGIAIAFWLCFVILHGLLAGFGMTIFLAVRACEIDANYTPVPKTTERTEPEPVTPIFSEPRLKAA